MDRVAIDKTIKEFKKGKLTNDEFFVKIWQVACAASPSEETKIKKIVYRKTGVTI